MATPPIYRVNPQQGVDTQKTKLRKRKVLERYRSETAGIRDTSRALIHDTMASPARDAPV